MTTTADRVLLEDFKISALSTGARVTEDALTLLGGHDQVTVHEYSTTGGIPMRVAGLEVNAPFDEWYCIDAEIEIDRSGEALVARFRGDELPVEYVHPLPGYLGIPNLDGRTVDDLVYTHLDRIRLSPIAGCAYDCAFCDMPGRVRLHSVEALLHAAHVALADTRLPVRHALISGGSPGPRDEQRFADTLVDLVRQLSPVIEIDVMMSSGPTTVELVKRLVDAGVHGFALNVEAYSDDASNLHIRGKHRRARPHFDATVSAAVALLGRGTGRVRSLILPGLEPAAETLVGVEHLASLGTDPVLSPFRPAVGTRLANEQPVSAGLLREVLDASREIVVQHGVALGPRCLDCQHNTLTFPWDVAP